jgi:hypothetical protein
MSIHFFNLPQLMDLVEIVQKSSVEWYELGNLARKRAKDSIRGLIYCDRTIFHRIRLTDRHLPRTE